MQSDGKRCMGRENVTVFVAWLCAILIALGVAHSTSAGERPEVTVEQGRLVGTQVGALRVFKGVPYALSPVGAQRWRAPADPAHWNGTRDADVFGASCIQPPYPSTSVYFEAPRPMSEDCLTLNIWSPKEARKAPVIVWIHGGGLLRGTSASPLYDGREFAQRGIVFVSVNYRLGILGWLAHPGLSAEAPDRVSGNYGLLDQIAALEWVKRNVGAFGGDAANVTVMGESAGALSISYLLASPRARGLFTKAIVQSTNARAVPHLREAAFGLPAAETIGTAFASAAGAADLQDLRALDAAAITNIALKTGFVSQPIIDGVLIPDQLVDIFDRGQQTKVPVLAGFNSGEIRSQRALIPQMPDAPAAYEAAIAARYGDLAPAYLKLYPASDIAVSQLVSTRDIVYGWATERLVRTMAAVGQPSYLYIFDYCNAATRARDLCAFHASELPFAFGLAGDPDSTPPNWPKANTEDIRLARNMVDYWASFATTGVPHADGAPAWPDYGKREAYIRFTATPNVGQNPEPGMFELHEDVMRRRRANGQQWFLNGAPIVSHDSPGR